MKCRATKSKLSISESWNSVSWFSLTFRVVRQGEEANTWCTSARSKHSDPVWISAEGSNIVLHPAQSMNLIEQAIVPFRSLVTCAEKPCRKAELKGIPINTMQNTHSHIQKIEILFPLKLICQITSTFWRLQLSQY